MANLPQDIVFDIFVRLPTKPLLRSRCLSKHWNHLISDYFMKSRSRRMILLPLQPLQAIHHAVPHDKTVHQVSNLRLPSPFKNPINNPNAIVIGTFNGIVVLLCKSMVLFNPLTGASKIIPDPPLESSSMETTYGFCCGTTLDDLKIVKLRLSTDYSRRVYCDVFSLKKGLWSTKPIKLEGGVYRVTGWYSGTFVNGYLYWQAFRSTSTYMILALDVKEMVFSEIQLPCLSRNNESLCTLSGRLHFFHLSDYVFASAKCELWVMNEDGIGKSWTKVLSSNIALSDYDTPLSIIDAERIVILDVRGQIIIYNMLKDSYDVYKLNPVGGCLQGLQAMEYVESLISPSQLFSTW